MKVNEEEKTELESDNFGCIIFGKLVIIFQLRAAPTQSLALI